MNEFGRIFLGLQMGYKEVKVGISRLLIFLLKYVCNFSNWIVSILLVG